MLFAANALQRIVSGKENPKTAPPFPLGFRHPAGGGLICCAIFTNFSAHVASGRVTKSQGEGAVVGFFFPLIASRCGLLCSLC